ncbi:MAG: thioredoxin family protein [Pirellulaceae bacterium]|nr:thioredoxin family protein [Pirellulaceae bacterium]
MIESGKPRSRLARIACCFFASILLVGNATNLFAQTNKKPSLGSALGGKKASLGAFGGFGIAEPSSGAPYKFSALYEAESGGQRGRVHLMVTLEPEHTIYSVTQPKGGPLATKIAILTKNVKLEGPFVAENEPKVSTNESGFEGVRVEKHFDQVSWTAPVSFAKPVAEGASPLQLSVDGQVCKDACIPIDGEAVEAEFGGFYEVAKPASDGKAFLDKGARTSWVVKLSKSSAKPGETVDLILSSDTDPKFYIYAVRPKDQLTESSTIIALSKKSSLLAGEPKPNEPPITKELIPGSLSVSYHNAKTQWIIPLTIPADSVDGIYPIEGYVGYQACNVDVCEEPLGIKFSGELHVDKKGDAQNTQQFAIEKVPYATVVKLPSRLTWIDEASADKASVRPLAAVLSLPTLLSKFALALLGGFILNLMPCVLPVIGLKVLSFVNEGKQGGSSVTMLNIWYIAGILSVFMALAFLTIGFRAITGESFGWGEQFGNFGMRIGLTILMFAMSLSFLGVWEIPIPGFATSQNSSDLMRREGPIGAYFKGLLTTVLATPCAAPGLGAVFSVTIDQPAWVILAMYFGVGLGMSLPYITIACWPSAIGFLPKPGAWMQTLKEVLAFPMLLSVVWFVSQFTDAYRIAIVTMLIFVWMACWWIGKVPVWSEWKTKFTHWGLAISFCTIATMASLHYLGPKKQIIDWVPYSSAALAKYQAEGKTVMIDFTAQWCANCKLNLWAVIETAEIAKVIEEQNIVPMLADWTDRSLAVKQKLNELRSASIPVLAIYPAGKQDEPIVLRDQLTISGLKAALLRAGPSQSNVDNGKKMTRVPVSTFSEPRR